MLALLNLQLVIVRQSLKERLNFAFRKNIYAYLFILQEGLTSVYNCKLAFAICEYCRDMGVCFIYRPFS